jgi:uncharacterized membrane protein
VNETASALDKTIEMVLGIGLATSALLLVLGLLLGHPELLRGGVLLLILTPVARVAVVTVALLHQGDRVFGAVSLWILLVLIGSAMVGARL